MNKILKERFDLMGMYINNCKKCGIGIYSAEKKENYFCNVCNKDNRKIVIKNELIVNLYGATYYCIFYNGKNFSDIERFFKKYNTNVIDHEGKCRLQGNSNIYIESRFSCILKPKHWLAKEKFPGSGFFMLTKESHEHLLNEIENKKGVLK